MPPSQVTNIRVVERRAEIPAVSGLLGLRLILRGLIASHDAENLMIIGGPASMQA